MGEAYVIARARKRGHKGVADGGGACGDEGEFGHFGHPDLGAGRMAACGRLGKWLSSDAAARTGSKLCGAEFAGSLLIRPEAVEQGVVKLVGPNYERIVEEAQRLLDDETAYKAMARGVSPYGDGHAAERIVKTLREHFT